MRFIVSVLISLLAVAVCILLFNQLFNQTIADESDTEEPDIMFVDKINFSDNEACKQARTDIKNYLKQPETACLVDQDCHFYTPHLMCGNAPVTNTAGNTKLNNLRDIMDKNCMYNLKIIASCVQTPFSGYKPVCLNNQCTSFPEINDSLLNKQIHDTIRSLQ